MGAAQHLIQLMKWLIGLLKVVSGPDNAVLGGRKKRKVLSHTRGDELFARIRQQKTAGARKTNYTSAGSAGLHCG